MGMKAFCLFLALTFQSIHFLSIFFFFSHSLSYFVYITLQKEQPLEAGPNTHFRQEKEFCRKTFVTLPGNFLKFSNYKFTLKLVICNFVLFKFRKRMFIILLFYSIINFHNKNFKKSLRLYKFPNLKKSTVP